MIDNLNKSLDVSFDLNLSESKYTMDQEAIDALGSIGELTESDTNNLRTLFEAAVNSKVKNLTEEISGKYETRLNELVEEVKEKVVDQVSDYLEVVVDEWAESNEIQITESIQNEKNAQLVEEIVKVLQSGYITVPDERKDLLKELSEEVKSLRDKLESEENQNVSLQLNIKGMKCKNVFNDLSEGLAETEKEKFMSLVEDLEINDVEIFEEKAKVIRGSFFKSTPEPSKEVKEENTPAAKPNGTGQSYDRIKAASRILGGRN